MANSIEYRPDVDGLRAVAIVPVVLFHAGFPLFSGGFIGVDVFFVISGFLITSLIHAELQAGTFSFSTFYERRIRRLLPAAVPVLLFVAIFAYIHFPPDWYYAYSKSVIAFFTFSSNWLFLSESGYFADPSHYKPLLHTWSLSIEEQYYLLFPALFAALLHWMPRNYRIVVVSFFVCSLLYSVHVVLRGEAEFAFFHTLARFWELLLGSMLALGVFPSSNNRATHVFVRSLGIAAITYSVFAFDESSPFPGHGALLPTIGAAMIIWSRPAFTDTGVRLLASRPIVYIGKISYSLYLWHWVLIVAVNSIYPQATSEKLGYAVLLAVILAILSYHVIEQPFRAKRLMRRKSHMFIALVVSIALLSASALPGIITQGLPNRFTDKLGLLIDDIDKQKNKGGPTTIYEPESKERPLVRILIVGDSHANDILAAVTRLNNFPARLEQFQIPNYCNALRFQEPGTANRKIKCAEHFSKFLQSKELADADYVFVVKLWYPSVDFADNRLPETLELIANNTDARLVLFGSKMRFKRSVVDVIQQNSTLSLHEADKINLSMYDLQSPHIQSLNNTLKRISTTAGARFFDVLTLQCPSDKCDTIKNRRLLYWDNTHWTKAGAEEFAARVEETGALDFVHRR